MKRIKTLLSLLLAVLLIISSPFATFADNGKGKGKDKKNKEEIKYEEVLDVEDKEEDENTDENTIGKGKNKEWKQIRDRIKEEKKSLNSQKHEIETQKKDLQKQYEEALSSGNSELANELRSQIEELKAQESTLKSKRKELQFKMVEVTRNKYTQEELDKLEKIKDELEKDEDIEVLPVENIIIVDGDVKFDAPPIVKDGRTLIPVRTLAEGFGASVEWVSEEQKVTISKGETNIVLHIDSNIAVVNGQEVEIDVASTLYDGRTYVPLRFIAETLGLYVNYDEETGVIEIGNEEEIAEEPVVDDTSEDTISN